RSTNDATNMRKHQLALRFERFTVFAGIHVGTQNAAGVHRVANSAGCRYRVLVTEAFGVNTRSFHRLLVVKGYIATLLLGIDARLLTNRHSALVFFLQISLKVLRRRTACFGT